MTLRTREERERYFQHLRARGCGDPACETHSQNKYIGAPHKPKTISEHYTNTAKHFFERVDTDAGRAKLDPHELFLIAVQLEAAYWEGRQDEWRVMSDDVPSAVGGEPYRGTERDE